MTEIENLLTDWEDRREKLLENLRKGEKIANELLRQVSDKREKGDLPTDEMAAGLAHASDLLRKAQTDFMMGIAEEQTKIMVLQTQNAHIQLEVMQGQEKYSNRLVWSSWVLTFVTLVLAAATIALVWATLQLR